MEKLSFASSHAEKSWKQSLFGRRRSVPRNFLLAKKGSRSSMGEDTLCSDNGCQTVSSDPSEFVIDEDYEFNSSFGIINRADNPGDMPLGQDQLVVSTNVKRPMLDSQLHRPKNAEHVLSLLQQGCNPNQRDHSPDSMCPIHTMVRNRTANKSECLEALLSYSDVDVNACDVHMMSALHFAAMNGDMRCVKLLLAFGADINIVSAFDQTPMNIAVAHDQEHIIKLLEALKGITAAFVEPDVFHPLPIIFRPNFKQHFPLSPASSEGELEVGTRISRFNGSVVNPMESVRLCDNGTQAHLHNLFSFNESDLVSVASQGHSFFHDHMQHLTHILTFKLHNGHRVLCLDGGWMRSLIEIDMLEQLEKFTGQKITDMFDVLIGSSSGAMIVLGLVYGECSLGFLRQMLFRMRHELFSNSSNDIASNTSLLKNYIRAVTGQDLKMSDIMSPSVMIPVGYKEADELQLKFFTNFVNDVYCQESVFEVALSATATPTWFASNGHFIDANVLANNPLDYALSYLQYHSYLLGQRFPLSLVVSLGAGVYKEENLKGVQPPSPSKCKDNFQKVQQLSMIMKRSILQSDEVASRCAVICQQLGVQFFRLNPHLKETVSVTECDTRKLINMILRSRIEMHDRNTGIEALKQYFLKLTESYNASGGGLGPYSSDATSPDGLLLRPSSENSSDEGKARQKRRT